MAERKWTTEQLSAINERTKTLLVSAAAGSGKTATLTERIIRSLTDSDNPINIESLLIVTFTKAAAAELRVKLSRALEEALARNPTDKRLEHQIYMLPSARIRTIDSFCNDVLRTSCDRVGVPPNYRLADAAECELLAISMIDGLISAVYSGELSDVATPEEFYELTDCLTDSKRTEEISEKLRFVYERCQSDERGVDSLLSLFESYDPKDFTTVEKTRHGAYLMMISAEMLDHYIAALSSLMSELSVGDAYEQKYFTMAESDLAQLKILRSADSYESLATLLANVSYIKKPVVKRENQSELMKMTSLLRDDMKADISSLSEYFLYTTDEWRTLMSELYRLLGVLYRFEKKFDELFFAEKKKRGALSYADIERLCFDCLIENGEPTDIALNLRGQIEALYIDEYQDVNSLQNRIFEVISRPDNRFMVGDIKQSIYGFRSARPEIFAYMKASFPPLHASSGDTASIFMSNNFRCDEGIVDFVNGIFDKCFSLIGESIGYESGDRLVYSKVHEVEPEYKKPVICILDKQSNNDDENDAKCDTAPDVVAKKIAELLRDGTLDSGAPIRPSDIAIIMRSAKGKDTLYAEALSKLGIPSEISAAKDFFLTAEVLLVLCLLNTIDNPRRDIYLAGLMCSPLFGFNADELCLIRGYEADSLYESLCGYAAENPDYERAREFLKTLDYYRTIAEGVGVDTLLFKLYQETGLIALAAKGGGEDNLMLLYEYARNYEAGAFKGLYNFISFINSILDKQTSFDDNRDVGASDAVKIVTCHSSKGLEYPVVFLVDAGAAFSTQELRQRLVISNDFGISFRLRSPSGLAVVNNPIHELVCHNVKRKGYEENLRVLYVALTRAREQLYVVGVAPTVKREEYELKLRLLREHLSVYSLRELRSYLEIALVTAKDPITVDVHGFVGGYNDGDGSTSTSSDDGEFTFPDSFDDCDAEELIGEYEKRFSYEYPRAYMTELPEKLSVSRTSPDVLDGADAASFAPRVLSEGVFDTQGGECVAKIGDNNEYIPEFDIEDLSPSENRDRLSKFAPSDDDDHEKTLHAPLLNSDFDDITAKNAATQEKKLHLPLFMTGREADESAKRGIATHYFMQFCDLELLEKYGSKKELMRLVERGYISERDGERVRLSEIDKFVRSELFRDMRSAVRVHRELRFNVRLPATLFTENEERRAAYSDSKVLVQGVIDCIVEYPDGTIGLYDYKTDRLTREELRDSSLAEKKLRDKHSLQLGYYAVAVERIFGKRPDRVEVYSLPLGRTVKM